MFCKSCGAAIDPSKKVCTSCGCEVPAKSNCGGYHDVVKELNKRGITDPNNPPQVYVTQKAPESKLWIAVAACTVVLLVVMILQIVILNKVSDYESCKCGDVVKTIESYLGVEDEHGDAELPNVNDGEDAEEPNEDSEDNETTEPNSTELDEGESDSGENEDNKTPGGFLGNGKN